MLIRHVLRNFKSWTQYQADRLGVSEETMLSIRAAKESGPYETWKRENANTQKLLFILDHCSAEEQRLYLKEFSTEELGRFLLRELPQIPKEELNAFAGIPLQPHVVPGWSHVLRLVNRVKRTVLGNDRNIGLDLAVRRVLREVLSEKLKELEWKNIDEGIRKQA
jgi:hypothetical protein